VEPSNSSPSIVVPSKRRLAGTGALEGLLAVPADDVRALAVPADDVGGAGVERLLGATADEDADGAGPLGTSAPGLDVCADPQPRSRVIAAAVAAHRSTLTRPW